MMSMDWLPTLLSLVGTSPDPSYPSDGIDLSAALAGAAPVPRTLCWRYLNLAQQACRSGDWTYLKILRSEEHTSELQSLMRISYAVFCLKKKRAHLVQLRYPANRASRRRQRSELRAREDDTPEDNAL